MKHFCNKIVIGSCVLTLIFFRHNFAFSYFWPSIGIAFGCTVFSSYEDEFLIFFKSTEDLNFYFTCWCVVTNICCNMWNFVVFWSDRASVAIYFADVRLRCISISASTWSAVEGGFGAGWDLWTRHHAGTCTHFMRSFLWASESYCAIYRICFKFSINFLEYPIPAPP